jgi:hypothetical protein
VKKKRMGGPDAPPPGSPAARAMENDRFGGPVPGAPPPRPAPITIGPPRRRPSSGVIPVASLPAEPPPLRGPGQRMGGPDPRPLTVLQRAQAWQALPSTPDGARLGAEPGAGLGAGRLADFRSNYRRTHSARLSPAQEALMARYLFAQNPGGAMFGDPGGY